MTVTDYIASIRPRTRLKTLLGIERSRLHQLLSSGRPIPVWLLARIAGRHLLPSLGRAKTAEMLLATLEHDFPECFDHARPPETEEAAHG